MTTLQPKTEAETKPTITPDGYRISRAYEAAWLLALALMFAIGASLQKTGNRGWPMVDRGPDSAVNTSLAVMTGARSQDLAREITGWLEKLPDDRPILILGAPGKTAALVTADLISYLSWPRPVVVSCDSSAESSALVKEFPERFCAVVLCHIAPPAGLPHSKSFGPALTLVSSGEVKE